MNTPGFRRDQTTWTWMAAFAAIVVLVLAGSYAYYQAEIDALREDRHRMLVAIGDLKVENVYQWRAQRTADAARIASNPLLLPIIQRLAQTPDAPGDPAERAMVRHFLQLERRANGYADAMLLAPDGGLLLSSSSSAGKMGADTRAAMQEALAADRPVLSNLYRDPAGAIRIDAVAPVTDAGGDTVALVLLRSDPRVDLFPLIQSWPTPSASAETLLVRRQGDDLLFLNDLRHEAGTAMRLRKSLTDLPVPAVQAVLGRQGLFEGLDYRGVDVLADLRAVPDSPWFMVAKMDSDEIMAEVHSRAALIAAIVALLILLTAAVIAYLYRRRQADLLLVLYQTENRERQAQEAFRTTLYSIGDAVITTDVAGRVREMNPVAEQLTGWDEAQARGEPLAEVFRIIDESSRTRLDSPVSDVLRSGRVVERGNSTVLLSRDGIEHPIADNAAPIRDGGDDVQGVVLVFSDQSASHAARKALHESEERVRLALAASRLGLFDVDIPTGVSTVNAEYAAMLGYASSGFHETHDSWMERLHPDDRARVARRYADYIAGRVTTYDLEFRLRARSGDWVWIHSIGSIVARDAEGRPLRMLGTHRDITERKEQQAELEYRASFDELTDLPNRHTMREKLQASLRKADSCDRCVGAILFNVDRLHHVNDTLGYMVGDQVLVEVAQRLRQFAQDNACVVGRIAGDEFLLVTQPLASADSVEPLAQRATRVLAQEFAIAGSSLSLTASAGVAWSSGAVTSASHLMSQADLAMMRAKAHGSNQVAVYSEALASKIADRIALSKNLRRALESNELSLHYQPLVDATLGHVAGVEALMRWKNPSLGVVTPVRFVPVAEDTGLIVPLGDWALRTALAQVCRWRDQGHQPVPVSVNVSLAQLRHPDFYGKLARTLEQSGVDPGQLKLEITESVVMDEPLATVPLLLQLKALGLRIVLDDFGTGYSSLSYLRELPIDEIKIDASFVKDVLKDDYATSLCTAIVSMSRKLQLVVVAEGVETQAQALFLTQAGCHYLQGFLFSRPVPEAQLGALLDGARWGPDGFLGIARPGSAANDVRH